MLHMNKVRTTVLFFVTILNNLLMCLLLPGGKLVFHWQRAASARAEESRRASDCFTQGREGSHIGLCHMGIPAQRCHRVTCSLNEEASEQNTTCSCASLYRTGSKGN